MEQRSGFRASWKDPTNSARAVSPSCLRVAGINGFSKTFFWAIKNLKTFRLGIKALSPSTLQRLTQRTMANLTLMHFLNDASQPSTLALKPVSHWALEPYFWSKNLKKKTIWHCCAAVFCVIYDLLYSIIKKRPFQWPHHPHTHKTPSIIIFNKHYLFNSPLVKFRTSDNGIKIVLSKRFLNSSDIVASWGLRANVSQTWKQNFSQ